MVIALHARTSRLADLRQLVPDLLVALAAAKPGFITIGPPLRA
jgi:hypothetical protein